MIFIVLIFLLGFLAFHLGGEFGSFGQGFVGHAFAFVQVGVDLGLVFVEQGQNDPVVDHGGSIQWAHQPDQEHALKT